MRYFLRSYLLVICIFLSPCGFELKGADIHKRTVVFVSEFTTRNREINDTTISLTSEFERALSKSSRYRIIEHRAMDKLRQQFRAQAVNKDSKDAIEKGLILVEAEMAIFGEIFFDDRSGDWDVTVSFVTRTGEKHLVESVRVRKAQMDDGVARAAMMVELVKTIDPDLVRKKDRKDADLTQLRTEIINFGSAISADEDELSRIVQRQTRASEDRKQRYNLANRLQQEIAKFDPNTSAGRAAIDRLKAQIRAIYQAPSVAYKTLEEELKDSERRSELVGKLARDKKRLSELNGVMNSASPD